MKGRRWGVAEGRSGAIYYLKNRRHTVTHLHRSLSQFIPTGLLCCSGLPMMHLGVECRPFNVVIILLLSVT